MSGIECASGPSTTSPSSTDCARGCARPTSTRSSSVSVIDQPAARLRLACAALGALTILGCASQPPAPRARPAPSAVPPASTPSRASTHPGLTVTAVGDVMMGTDFPENILPDDDGVGFLAAVTPQLSTADVTFGNLE